MRPVSITPGSFRVEVLLWICFLIPGLIYSLCRIASRYQGCPVCGASHQIPLESPAGRLLDAM